MSAVPDIQFDAARHEYRVGGARWPSVSEIIDQLQILEGIPRAVLEAAAAFGQHVHEAVHLDNLGVLDEASLDPPLLPYLQAWRAFRRDTGAVVIASERIVTHPRLQYAGRLDSICLVGGHRELVDVKSTAAIPRTVGPQTWGYAAALGEPRIRRRCVQLREDGTYRSVRLTDRRDENWFVSALNCWRFINAA